MNNAGITRDAMLHKMSIEHWREILVVCYCHTGTLACTWRARQRSIFAGELRNALDSKRPTPPAGLSPQTI